MSDRLLMKPMRGYMLVQRIKKNASTKAGVFVPRRDQEETSGAMIIHPGWYHSEFTQGEAHPIRRHHVSHDG